MAENSVVDTQSDAPQTSPAPSEAQSVVKKEIRLDIIAHSLVRHKKTYLWPMIIVFVITTIFVFSIPRYYKVKVMLAPESSNTGSGMSGLSSMASMVGINLSSLNSEDAIVPMFYPDIMKSTDFAVPLLNAKVQTADGKFKGSFVDYLTKGCKATWWDVIFLKFKNALSRKKPETLQRDPSGAVVINPFKLTRMQDELVRGVIGSISCTVDKKTDVITITTTAQDPLVAALFADTVMHNLQEFITNYRTKKAKNDLAHYRELLDNASKAYIAKQQEYASHVDANQDVVLASYKVKEESLENELQLAYNTYSQLKAQVQIAESKVMERTPAFTTLQNASVPIKPAGPKRMITVAVMLVLCFFATSVYVLAHDKTLKF